MNNNYCSAGEEPKKEKVEKTISNIDLDSELGITLQNLTKALAAIVDIQSRLGYIDYPAIKAKTLLDTQIKNTKIDLQKLKKKDSKKFEELNYNLYKLLKEFTDFLGTK
jgi:hypothetical protein